MPLLQLFNLLQLLNLLNLFQLLNLLQLFKLHRHHHHDHHNTTATTTATATHHTHTMKLTILKLAAHALLAAGALALATRATAQTNTLQNAIQSGKATIDARLRYEFVDQDGMPDNANAITLRTRLGYTTAPFYGLDAGIMAENVVALDNDYYDSVNDKPQGNTTKSKLYPQVMDPAVTEVNQAWLRYTAPADIATQVTIGRQRIAYDNLRFIGDVAWRQDNQTFDAIALKNTTIKNLTINYAWLWRVNRVQGDQRDWRSNSHLINLSYAACQYATIAAYGYLLDFHNPTLPAAAAATATQASTKTFGASLAGAPAITTDIKLNYRLEYAGQNNYGHNNVGYTAAYLAAELGATALAKYNLTLGCERLTTDKGQGFRMPLGTNHAFNGWSDFILPTGNNFVNGLRDYYLRATIALPANLQLIACYHKLDKDWQAAGDTKGKAYGNEYDASLAYRLNKNIAFMVKTASFAASKTGDQNLATPNVSKVWLQTEYTF